jgi:dTDP-L-rhamnose 4-epimerase
MSEAVLVTGGAGFIGSHLVDRLVHLGRRVRVLDSLESQVHGQTNGYRNPHAEYLEGTILDRALVMRALEGVEAVVHLAARVGVGQSMYEMARYVRDNSLGTAVLLEALADRRDAISSLVVASSMSIYGEGQYACPRCGTGAAEVTRTPAALQARRWEPLCTACGTEVLALPTSELKRLRADSVYAVTKRDHEDLCLIFGRAYGVRTVALRFFNAYGRRQSLSNPYTGVVAIFASRLLNGASPAMFEDGLQTRDFVHVSDIVQAIELALGAEGVGDVALNVGTGVPTTVCEIAHFLAEELMVDIAPSVIGRFRQGDIRHCYADISAARHALGYEPRVALREGLRELVAWIVEAAPAAQDMTRQSTLELQARGLVV